MATNKKMEEINMAIGQRIKFFRNRKDLTQKQLGEMLGFHGKSSDVRMAQYESEARIPKQELIKEMADRLEVDTKALTVPNIDNYLGLMHTFFALEDMYGLTIEDNDGKICFCFDPAITEPHSVLNDYLKTWLREKVKLEHGEITKEQYDEWRYKYPALETLQKK